MNRDYLVDQIRSEISRQNADTDVTATVTDVLVRAGVDLTREPVLEDVKYMLVEAFRTADECRRVAC